MSPISLGFCCIFRCEICPQNVSDFNKKSTWQFKHCTLFQRRFEIHFFHWSQCEMENQCQINYLVQISDLQNKTDPEKEWKQTASVYNLWKRQRPSATWCLPADGCIFEPASVLQHVDDILLCAHWIAWTPFPKTIAFENKTDTCGREMLSACVHIQLGTYLPTVPILMRQWCE